MVTLFESSFRPRYSLPVSLFLIFVQSNIFQAMRKYNEVKSILDVERAQVLETVLVMERNRFKFLIDAYSNVVKSEIVLGETMSGQWKGLAQWEVSLMTGLSVCPITFLS